MHEIYSLSNAKGEMIGGQTPAKKSRGEEHED